MLAVELGGENQDHVIRAMLPRRTCFARKMPGNSSQAQVIGANIDIVAVVTDAGPDFNVRRMERYFTLITRSGAKAVVLVNKSDLFSKEENQQAAAQIAALWDAADVHITSALKGEGLKTLKRYLKKGVTMCVVGSSGVGKSTLASQLALAAGVGVRFIVDLEAGKPTLRLENVLRVIDALGGEIQLVGLPAVAADEQSEGRDRGA